MFTSRCAISILFVELECQLQRKLQYFEEGMQKKKKQKRITNRKEKGAGIRCP